MNAHSAPTHALLHHLIDYAGLFPPAQRAMGPAVKAYAGHYDGRHAWMLGRFVVPAPRLAEFAGEAEALLPRGGDVWRLSALLGTDAEADAAAVSAFNASHRAAVCDAVEFKAANMDDIARAARAMRGMDVAVYVEVPVDVDLEPLLGAIASRKWRAKGTATDAEAILTERDPSAFTFEPKGVGWREILLLTPRLAQLRDRLAISFGSCSFSEPVEDLTALGLL